jgi:hypothetical protein
MSIVFSCNSIALSRSNPIRTGVFGREEGVKNSSNIFKKRVQKVLLNYVSSFRRKPESSFFEALWTPASAGVTGFGGFLDTR